MKKQKVYILIRFAYYEGAFKEPWNYDFHFISLLRIVTLSLSYASEPGKFVSIAGHIHSPRQV